MTDELSTGTILSLDDNDPNWKASWQKQLNDLKSKISGLPVYTLTGSNTTLESFDRATSTRRLDNAIRNYLTEHNPAQKGFPICFYPFLAAVVTAYLSNLKHRTADYPIISAVGLKALRRAAMRFPYATVTTKQGRIFCNTWNLKSQIAANPSNFAFKAAFEWQQ